MSMYLCIYVCMKHVCVYMYVYVFIVNVTSINRFRFGDSNFFRRAICFVSTKNAKKMHQVYGAQRYNLVKQKFAESRGVLHTTRATRDTTNIKQQPESETCTADSVTTRPVQYRVLGCGATHICYLLHWSALLIIDIIVGTLHIPKDSTKTSEKKRFCCSVNSIIYSTTGRRESSNMIFLQLL